MEFLRANARWLLAGIIMTAASGPGQTYFISIFAGEIRSEFGLTNGQWGGIYTAGTLASAIMMLLAGPLVDRMASRQMATIILVIFSMVCVLMAVNSYALILIIGIFGLRFCGQGMMGHIAMVATGRWFAANRGRAVSIVALGFSAGEALLPILFVAISAALGWRVSWIIVACAVLLIIPILRKILAKERTPDDQETAQVTLGLLGKHWTRGDALNHWLFWALVPATLALPVFSTATFFHQVHLTETKGWSLAGFVALIPLMTAATIGSMLVTGRLIDRFSSFAIVPFFLLPAAVGYLVMANGSTLWMGALGLALMGLSHGAYQTVGGTLWPEIYGTKNLGAIRSITTSAMVFGTAMGPGITGVLIDMGYPYEDQLYAISGIVLICAGLATLAIKRTVPLRVAV